MSVFSNIGYELRKQGMLTVLMIINISVFLVVNISAHILNINLVSVLGMPTAANEFMYRFWTLITYMFTHLSLGHIFYNLMLFYFCGRLFVEFIGEKRLLYTYVMGGVFGGALLIVLSLFFPSFSNSLLIGASAAVMAIVIALVFYIPDLSVNVFFIFNIPYKYFAALIFIVSTIIDLSQNTGGKVSHIGGALFGLLYGYNLKNGRDFLDFSLKPKKKSTLKVVHKQHLDDHEYSHIKQGEQKIIDELLDKISKNGYDSLSKQEKEFLFKLSQKK